MYALILLFISALSEALWNICLAKSKGLTDWRANLIGVAILCIGIWSFKRSLALMPLSIAIVIWSGAALLLTIALDMYIFKTRVDALQAILMAVCIAAMLCLNYYSASK